MSMSEKLLRTMANELPVIIRQLQAEDATLNFAALQRLDDFAQMTAVWRGQKVSRRRILGAGVTFAAMAIKPED